MSLPALLILSKSFRIKIAGKLIINKNSTIKNNETESELKSKTVILIWNTSATKTILSFSKISAKAGTKVILGKGNKKINSSINTER